MEHVQPYLDYFAAHPQWAIAIVFLIAFGEALLIIGLFVPSTVVLVGAGTLVGTGSLPFWPVFLATTLGAFAGDQVSFWAGKLYGDRLRTFWPLNRYPALVAKGEAFVREHGGKSIAIGRFVPGVKAVVPGIVGMLNMNQVFFFVVNSLSSVVWAAAHVFPGILIGQGLAMAGELSGRLMMVLLVLLVLLALAGWLVRLLAASVAPHFNGVLHQASVWARARPGRAWKRFGRALSPGNPRRSGVVLFMVAAVAGVLLLADLVSGLVVREAVSNLDVSVATLMSEWRNAPADELMVPLAMMADRQVLWIVGGAMVGWLLLGRAWRAALVAAALIVCGELVSLGLGALVGQAPPVVGLSASDGTFPSAHVLLAGIVFGLLAVLASHTMGRWSKSIVIAVCSVLLVTVGFARIYLGADWLSGVLGGILLATVLSGVFGTVIEAIPSRRIKPLGLVGFTFVSFLVAWTLHMESGLAPAQEAYARPAPAITFTQQEWAAGKWSELPGRRIDLAGKPEDVFVAQWMGDLKPLEDVLRQQGWTPVPMWTWRQTFTYLDPKANLQDLAPRPLLHQGLKAKLTLVRPGPGDNYRQVLRVYKTRVRVQEGSAESPVFVVSLQGESKRPHFGLYDVPATLPAPPDQQQAFMTGLEQSAAVRAVAQGSDPEKPRVAFAAVY